MKGNNRKIFNRVISWLLVFAMTLPLCLTNGMVVNAAAEDVCTYLSDLTPSASEGDFKPNGAWDSEKLMDMAGTKYDKGLNMHSPRWIEYNLDADNDGNGDYDIFTARISPDGASNDVTTAGIRVTSVDIFLDGERAYTTGVMYAKKMYEEGTAYIACNINVSGKNKLKIVVNEETDADIGTDTMHSNTKWGDAVVVADPKLYKVTEVDVTAANNATSVTAGATLQFSADVAGDPEDKVTWSIVSATTSASTSISDEGLLTVGADETLTTLTVKAASRYNGEVFKTSTVTVIPAVIIENVTVTPATAEVVAGGTVQFSADVTGDDNDSVTWAVTGNSSNGTTISDAGLLTVDANETVASLTVTATSQVDNTKKGTATVKVYGTYIYLCDLDVKESTGGPYNIDKDIDGKVIKDLSGNTYEHGIGMHSPRSIEYNLAGKYETFTAKIFPGNFDKADVGVGITSVDIYLDGQKTYTTGVMYAKGMQDKNIAYVDCNIDVSGANTLKIVVNEEPNADISPDTMHSIKNHSDRIVVAEPKLYFDSEGMQLLVNDNKVEDFSLAKTEYKVTGNSSTLEVVLADAEGNALPVPVSYSGETATFSVNGRTYTINYTVDENITVTSPYIYLCELDVKGSTGGVYSIDTDIDGQVIKDLSGNTYEHGIGMHSPRSIEYDLAGKYETFTAKIFPGNFDKATEGVGITSVDIYLNGQKAYTTGVMYAKGMQDKDIAYVDCNIDVSGADTLKIVVNEEPNADISPDTMHSIKSHSDRIVVAEPKLYISDRENIKLLVNGNLVEGFNLDTKTYTVEIEDIDNYVVTFADEDGYKYPVDVDYVNNTAVFKLGDEEYTVTFNIKDGDGYSYPLENLVIKLDGKELEGFDVNEYDYRHLLPEDSSDIPEVTAFLIGENDQNQKRELQIKNVIQAEQLPDCAIVTLFGQDYMIRFANDGAWTQISTELPDAFKDGDIASAELDYTWDYTETMVMKLFMAKAYTTPVFKCDEALEAIKQADNVTAGIPKIVYLVGWQYDGHDTGYPNWDKVNPEIKCKVCKHDDPNNEGALACLKWLMDEAWNYNTAVSFHLNTSDAYPTSPDTEIYIKNDLYCLNDGEFFWDGMQWYGRKPYRVNHWNEWNSGFFVERVDELCEMLDGRLEKAGTVHSDAYQCIGSDNTTLEQDARGRAAMIRYWNSKGIDLTTEVAFVYDASYAQNTAKPGENWSVPEGCVEPLLGLMPCAWHNVYTPEMYLKRPASVMTNVYNHNSVAQFIFGSSAPGENRFTERETTALPTGWDTAFAGDFATTTAISFYMYQFDRLGLENNDRTAIYSDGLIADYNTRKVYFADTDIVLRENNNIFVPMVWEEDAVLAYSESGYTNKTWTFTPDWTDEEYTSVDVYVNDKAGRTLLDTVEVVDGKITLSVDAKQMLIIKPHLSLTDEKAAAKEALADYKDPADYREAQKAELQAAIEAGNAAIDTAATEDAIAKALADAKAVIDKIKTDAQLKAEENAAAGNGGGTGSSSSSNSKGESSKKEEATHVETVYAPSASASTGSVSTGDGAPLGVMLAVMALAAAGIAFAIVKRRKRV